VQEAGCGARHSLQRCRKQGAVHGLRVRGAKARDWAIRLLPLYSEETRPSLPRESGDGFESI
jgi:hypothetical protein